MKDLLKTNKKCKTRKSQGTHTQNEKILQKKKNKKLAKRLAGEPAYCAKKGRAGSSKDHVFKTSNTYLDSQQTGPA